MTHRERLRAIRHALFDQMAMAESPEALFELQLAIATEIQESEKVANEDRTGEVKWHMRLLRCYGDAIAWSLLYPHTIRQLAKNPSAPLHLSGQKGHLETTLQLAREYAQDGTLVLIADITNCIKVGDIIICDNPELPVIGEVKTRFVPEQSMQGRTGRQLSRMMSILKYLHEGKGKLFKEELTSVRIDISSEIEFSWHAVNQAVEEALHSGEGIGISSDSDIVWAFCDPKWTYSDRNSYPEIPKRVRSLTSRFKTGCLGCHARLLEEPSPLIPPPLVWPIDHDSRFALTEAEVILYHFIDVNRFTKIETEYGQVVQILSTKGEINGFTVEAKGQQCTLSNRFLTDVLYGFQTIESTARSMIELAKQISESRLKPSPLPAELDSIRKPKVIVIRTKEEADHLAQNARAYSDEDFVALPMALFDQIKSAKKRHSP